MLATESNICRSINATKESPSLAKTMKIANNFSMHLLKSDKYSSTRAERSSITEARGSVASLPKKSYDLFGSEFYKIN